MQAEAKHAAALAAAAAAKEDDDDGDAADPSTFLTVPDEFDFDAAAAKAQYDYVEDVHSSVESLRAHALLSCQVGFLGIFLMIAAREVEWSYDGSSTALNVALVLRCLNSCVTVYLLYLIYRYNWIENHIDNINAGFLNELSFWPNKRLTSLAIEFVICAVHDFPFLDTLVAIDLPIDQNDYLLAYFGLDIVPVSVSAPWSLFMFLRFYLIGRVMRDRAFSSGANILGMFSNFPFNTEFAIRAILDGDSMPTLLQFFFLLQVACSYSLHVCERPADFGSSGVPGNKSFTGAVWLSLVTMTTVGYGDLLPLTLCGRGVMLLNVFVGLCILSGILSAFNGMITMLPFESRMEDFIAFDVVKWNFWNSASSVIAHAWRNYKARKASLSMLQAGSNYLIHYHFVHAINRFYDARISFNSYDGRYHGSAYLVQCLRVMLRRASLCANLTFGDDREPTYVDNFIVNQMAIILSRDVAENKVQNEEARLRAILDAHHERIRAGFDDDDDESMRSSDSERSEEEEEIEGMARKVTRPLNDYEQLRRRIQRRQRLVASASSFTGSGKRRLFSFRFRDGPSALQKRLVHIRSGSAGAHSGSLFSSRDDQESHSWTDEQRPEVLPQGKHHVDIRLPAVGRGAQSAPSPASSRPLSARSPKQNLVRYGSIRPADVLQYVINTPSVKAVAIPTYVLDPRFDSTEARVSSQSQSQSQSVESDPLALDGPVLQVGEVADSQAAVAKPKKSKISQVKTKRRIRAPGEHHHHHHLHGSLPPPPLPTPVPHLVESTVRILRTFLPVGH
jgi:hypothetical protein